MDEFGAIPVFVAVVESGGFSAAAKTLGVSKSAVSKRINRLEAYLGVRLLYRTTRKLSLTEAGERYPNLQIELVMDDRRVDLVAAGFDVAIRSQSGNMPDSTMIARKLAPLRQVLCASPGYVERHGLPSTPTELSGHNCVLFSYLSDANEWTLHRDGKPETVLISGNYRVNNSEALLEALREGMGIGRLPTFVAGPDLQSGRLVKLFDSYRIPDQEFYAVLPQREYLPAKVRAFLDFSIEYFGGDQPYWDR